MNVNKSSSGFHPVGHGFPLIEHNVDVYRMQGKLPEPTICPQCNAVFLKGRWQWAKSDAGAHQEVCPACHRQNDKRPAGILILKGPFLVSNQDEILQLVSHHEQHERAEHPLKRIIGIEKSGDSVTITTTDIHLAQGIAKAVHHAYQGELEMQYSKGQNQVRAEWKR